MFSDWQLILRDISSWSIILPLIIGCLLIRYLSKDSWFILGVVFAGSISQITNFFYPEKEKFLNLIYNIYTPVEFFLIYFLLKLKWHHKGREKVFNGLCLFYIAISAFFISTFDLSKDFISSWAWSNNLIYIIWIVLLLYEQYDTETIFEFSPATALFWFIIGILLYAPCTMTTFFMWDFIHESKTDLAMYLKIIHHIFNINMYVFFTIGFAKDYNQKKKAFF